jgi:hypothetical protein
VATGLLCLAVWLFLAAAEAWSPLHAWLHGGTIPKDDNDCAIVAINHGKIETVAAADPVPVPVTWIEVTPRVTFTAFTPVIEHSPADRGPPATPCSPV